MRKRSRLFPSALAGTAFLAMAAPLAATGQQEDEAEEGTENPDTQTEEAGEAIVVTGTRIRGARSTGETITIDRDTIVEAGQVDLGEAIRSLPQNFGGGQNPGVGFGTGAGENVNSASAANLRGLGPDATLTLLNGHRLPYAVNLPIYIIVCSFHWWWEAGDRARTSGGRASRRRVHRSTEVSLVQ